MFTNKNTQEMESTRKLLSYLLSQYPNRSCGSLNESLTLDSLKNELHKVCDLVEEQHLKMSPCITQHKWVFISLYFGLIMISGLIHPLLLLISTSFGTVFYWLIYDKKVKWMEYLFPRKETKNIYGEIHCIDYNHCFNEKNVLFVSHICDCTKEKSLSYHLCGIFIHWNVYVLLLLTISGYVYALLTGNHIFMSIISISSLPLILFSISMYVSGNENKVSGLATTLSLIQLSQKLKQNNSPLFQSTNVSFLITSSHTERHEGIRTFLRSIQSHSEQLEKLRNTIVICIDELDDSESLCCYSQEGIIFGKYSKTIINQLQDASQQLDICLGSVANHIYKPFTAGKQFLQFTKQVVPIVSKCRGLKRKYRDEKENQVIKHNDEICIHDDQILCIDYCSSILLKFLQHLDNSDIIKEIKIGQDDIQMEIIPDIQSTQQNESTDESHSSDVDLEEGEHSIEL